MREGWEYKKLGEVATFHRGLTYSKEDEAPLSSKCVLRSNNIDLETGTLNLSELKYLREDFDIPQDKLLKSDSIFICMSNGSKQHVGKVAYIKEDSNYAFGGFMGLIIPLKTSIFPKFLYYFFLSSEYRSLLLSVGNGIGITNLKFSDLSTFPIPIPPLSVQQSIVSELDMLSGLIAKHEEQLKAYDELAQSIFYDMFGDPIENEKGWEVKKLGEVAKEKLSYGSGASAKQYDGKVRYVRITDIKDDGELNTDMVSPDTYDEKYLLNEGDILFARSGATVGKTFQYKGKYGKCIYAGYLIRLVPNTELVLPSYVFGYTKSPYYRSFVAMAQNAVAQPNINAKQYSDLLLPLPPLSLQTLFAEKIEAIERQKGLVQQSIAEVQTLFDSRMDYYFNEG